MKMTVSDVQQIPLGPSCTLSLLPQFIDTKESDKLVSKWTKELNWVQSEIFIYGKKVAIPRLNAWYGDKAYAYSGTQFAAQPWTNELAELKARIEQTSNLEFNSVLINWYRNGQDSMGWHSDDEKCLGDAPQIASLSLGESRRFIFREKSDHSNKKELLLSNGSLLLMLGETQRLWQHSLPKTRKSIGDRVNLTFRQIEHPL